MLPLEVTLHKKPLPKCSSNVAEWAEADALSTDVTGDYGPEAEARSSVPGGLLPYLIGL